MPYLIIGQDSYIDLLRGRRDVSVCPSCKVATHPFAQGFVAKRKPKHDLCGGTEEIDIISPRFKTFLEEYSMGEVDYYPMPSGFFVIRPVRSVFLDLRGKRPMHTSFCETCGRMNAFHAAIFDGQDKILIGQGQVADMEILRAAQQFGSAGHNGSPIIVGDGLGQAIKDAKFKGVVMNKVAQAK